MASLYNNKISATYVGLIKTLDSAVINATLRELSDGLGNQTGLFINTSGDFKATGILEFGSLKDTGENITITKFVDEADGIANNDNDTTIPTSAAIIDYVASQVTLEDLDFSGDSGSGSVDLDTQTFAIVGTSNEIETSASGQQLQIGLPSSISVNLVGNVTGDLTGNVTGDLTGNVTATSVLADGVTATTQSSNDNSTKVATTAYVDAQVTAEDLDFAGDSGTGSVDLDSQSLSITGTTNQVTTSATNQTLNISLPATVHRNLQGDVTGDLTGNVTGNVTGNLTGDVTGDVTGDLTGNVTATSVLADGVTATTQSQGDNSTKVATTAYVDAGLSDQDTLAEVLAVGNTTGGTDIAVSAGDDITFTDTSKAIFGDGSDLQIYHEGSDSYIKDAGTGNLNINADQLVFKSSSNTETKAVFNTNGAVELYHDDSKKLETVTNGVDITGNSDISGQITVGTSDTLLAENALRFKSSGDAFIDQNTVGQSLYIRTSNASSLDTNAVIIASDGDIDLSGSLTIAQNLTVNGTTTTVNTETLAVEDPLISMAKDNAANSVDIGFYGRYNDGSNRYLGLYADASDTNTFKLFKGTTTEPTTTVDSTATGYTLASLDVASLTATGFVNGASISLGAWIQHTNDLDTFFGFPSDDNFSLTTGGNANLTVSSSTVTLKHSGSTKLETVAGGINVTGGGTFTGDVEIQATIPKLSFTDLQQDDWDIINDNGEFKFLCSTGSGTALKLDTSNNATFAGGITTTSATGIKIDTTGNAILELDGAAGSTEAIIFRHSGTEVSRIAHSNSTNLVFSTGSSVTTALTLDSSQNATFAGAVEVGSSANNRLTFTPSNGGNTELTLRGGKPKIILDKVGAVTECEIAFDTDLSFRTNDTDAERFRLYNTGGAELFGDDQYLKFTANDGSTQYGRLYQGDGGFIVEGQMNNDLILRSLSNGNDEGIKFQNRTGGVTTTNMFLTKQGYLGINEDIPLVPLHISRDSASGENIALILDNNDTAVGAEIGMLFRCNTNSSNADYEIFAKSYGSNDSALVFQSDGSVETFRLNKNGSQEWNMSNATINISGSTGGNITLANTTGEFQFRANGSSVNSMNISSSLITLNENVNVNGDLSVRDTLPIIQLYNTDDGLGSNQTLGDIDWYQIDPSADGVGTVAKIRCQNISSFSGVGELSFQTGSATTLAERLRISHTGETTIKITDDGTSDLTVLNLKRIWSTGTGTDRAHGITFSDANATNAAIYADRTNSGSNYDSDLVFITNTGASGTDTSEKLRIKNNGNVAINNTTAQGRLSVWGSMTIGSANYDSEIELTETGDDVSLGNPGGTIELNLPMQGTTTAGCTLTFTYEKTNWASWVLDYEFASTSGLVKGVIGGYNNGSTGHGKTKMIEGFSTSVGVSNAGTGNQHTVVTFTFSSGMGIHPFVTFKYKQGGADGVPRADRVKINYTDGS